MNSVQKALSCQWQVDGISTGNYREEDKKHMKGKMESDTSQNCYWYLNTRSISVQWRQGLLSLTDFTALCDF